MQNGHSETNGHRSPPPPTGEVHELEDLDALVVGAGFSGLWQLYNLRKAGFKVKAFESGHNLGGIWYFNRYPGARVDSDVPLYEYSLEELWRGWNWTEKFPGWQELRAYFDYVEKKLDLKKDIRFNAKVTKAVWDNDKNQWDVWASDGSHVRTRFLILTVGFAAKRYTPYIKGLDTFLGECHHTGDWPEEGVVYEGKRVGVIGTGASGVQVIQTVGPKVKHLTVFQRTPNLAVAMQQEKLDKVNDKSDYPEIFRMRTNTFAGYHFDNSDKKTFEVSPEERLAHYESLWQAGGFRFWLGTFNDMLWDQAANEEAYKFWREKVRARINDPVKKELLAPMKAPHAFGTKRPSLEQTYYEVYNQPNVDLINLRENPIDEITPLGVKTADGVTHELDLLVLATGFDSVTGSLLNIDIEGVHGAKLEAKWKHGTWTYLGMTTADFPNMFFPYGPQAPTAFCNGPTCAELQGDWVIDCLKYLRAKNLQKIDTLHEAEDAWRKHATELNDASLFPGTSSWYMGANVPGKPREVLNYIGGLRQYNQRISEVAENDYRGFVTV
ncbi:FAD dependent oxidoreductase [Xylona heveae TC161]|uniref:FAD dependent oxidoreductase n=1 Tax=Xylona heveae (strain CBS 132557 / TC161) TaxID=1328760 RepID=A0A165GBR6_XYLHT|nr:FAD dependent oxidoreductase [Xylona heveae TC161]KZF21997.1 FAD dependent oxidoreductase [Xylona heveae TC161]